MYLINMSIAYICLLIQYGFISSPFMYLYAIDLNGIFDNTNVQNFGEF